MKTLKGAKTKNEFLPLNQLKDDVNNSSIKFFKTVAMNVKSKNRKNK